LIMFVGYLLPFFFRLEPGAWRRFYLFMVLMATLSLVGVINYAVSRQSWGIGSLWIGLVAMAICAGMFAISVVGDIVRKTPRGWLNWLGVSTYVLASLYQALTIAMAYWR